VRLTRAKVNSGFSFGECGLLKLSYCDLRNTVRVAPAHQWLIGIIKKDMWGGFYKLLGLVAGVQLFRRCDERKRLAGVAVPDSVHIDAFSVCTNVLI